MNQANNKPIFLHSLFLLCVVTWIQYDISILGFFIVGFILFKFFLSLGLFFKNTNDAMSLHLGAIYINKQFILNLKMFMNIIIGTYLLANEQELLGIMMLVSSFSVYIYINKVVTHFETLVKEKIKELL